MRPSPFLLALALVACTRSDRSASSTTPSAAASVGYAGPQSLVLRLPRLGGTPRVFAYPRVDSLVWASTDPAPIPAQVLAFDDESGNVAYEDNRGRPAMLELRLGTITVGSNRKLSGLTATTRSAIFGIADDGSVVRVTPTGEWTFKPPQPASVVFPQPFGELLVVSGTGANTHLLKLTPPDKRITKELPFPAATRTVRTQLGDRLYLAVDSGLVVLRTRTMDWARPVPFDEPIVGMASTPSGDRLFVLTDARREIHVVDRYREAEAAKFEMPGKVQELRVDPFGRYLLARSAENDSVWVVAIGTQRIIGGFRSAWRNDIPFVGNDGAIAAAVGADVTFIDGETLRERARVRGGAQDYWYPLLWDGFRPRAASLDEPVTFDSTILDATRIDSLAAADTTPPVAAPAPEAPTADTARSGFIVSFAAFLVEERARELASRIKVGGESARVITTVRDGTTIYRVILGPFVSKDEADRAGRESGQSYWVYEGMP